MQRLLHVPETCKDGDNFCIEGFEKCGGKHPYIIPKNVNSERLVIVKDFDGGSYV